MTQRLNLCTHSAGLLDVRIQRLLYNKYPEGGFAFIVLEDILPLITRTLARSYIPCNHTSPPLL